MIRTPSMIVRASVLFSLLLLIGSARVLAQTIPVRTYTTPLWTSSEGFTSITGIRELRDGRVILLDSRQNEVWVLDANGKSTGQLGRKGDGPGEYRYPNRILALRGDSTLLLDREARRYVVFGADLKPSKSVRFPDDLGSRPAFAGGVDEKGRLLFTSDMLQVEGKPPVRLLRWDRATNHVDSLFPISLPPAVEQITGDPTKTIKVSDHSLPNGAGDVWGAMVNGSILVFHESDLHLEMHSAAGALTRGAPIAFTRTPRAPTERDEIAKLGFKTIPDFAPAFDDFLSRISPDGEIWLHGLGVKASPEAAYAIINSNGKLLARATLAKGRQVVGITSTRVYVSHHDADGLVWLEAIKR